MSYRVQSNEDFRIPVVDCFDVGMNMTGIKMRWCVEDNRPMADIRTLLRRAGTRDPSRKPFFPHTDNHVRPRSSSFQRLDRPFKQIEPAPSNDSIFFSMYRKM